MTKPEKVVIDFIKKHLALFFLIAISALGIWMRIKGFPHVSGDYGYYLRPWWKTIKSAGAQGLAHQVGNYNIPYQIIIWLFTLTPLKSIVSYKLLSVVFDYVLAAASGLLVYEVTGRKSVWKPLITYSLVLCSLTVVFNSAFWAQCDSIYVAFIILALYFAIRDKRILCFVMLGLSFTFKLQFVFILPLFVYYYVNTKKVSLLHFLIIPAVDIIACLPAVFMGRPFAEIFTVYFIQTNSHQQMVLNFPNIYNMLLVQYHEGDFFLLKTFGIILTVTILGGMLALIMKKRYDLTDPQKFLLTGIWSAITCIMFLPAMHERYGYLVDVLLIIYAVLYRKHIVTAILCNFFSLLCYSHYLLGANTDVTLYAYVYTGVYLYLTWSFVRSIFGKPDTVSLRPNILLK